MNLWREREKIRYTDQIIRSANNTLSPLHNSFPFLPKQVRCLKDLIKVSQKIEAYLEPYTTDKGIDVSISSLISFTAFCLMDLVRLARILASLDLTITALIIKLVQVLTSIIEVIQASTISRNLLHRLKLSIQTLSIRILTTPKAVQSF